MARPLRQLCPRASRGSHGSGEGAAAPHPPRESPGHSRRAHTLAGSAETVPAPQPRAAQAEGQGIRTGDAGRGPARPRALPPPRAAPPRLTPNLRRGGPWESPEDRGTAPPLTFGLAESLVCGQEGFPSPRQTSCRETPGLQSAPGPGRRGEGRPDTPAGRAAAAGRAQRG